MLFLWIYFAWICRYVCGIDIFFCFWVIYWNLNFFFLSLVDLQLSLRLLGKFFVRIMYHVFYIFSHIFVRSYIFKSRLLELFGIIYLVSHFTIRCNWSSCSSFLMRVFFLYFWLLKLRVSGKRSATWNYGCFVIVW